MNHTDSIGIGPTTILTRCPGYKSAGGRKIRPQPESGKKTIIGRPTVGGHRYDVTDERFEKQVQSLALMDAYLARPSGGRAVAYFEGVGLASRLHMRVGR